MTYVDAVKLKDQILIVDRIDGERVFNTVPVRNVAYYSHGQGSFTSIFGDSCKKIEDRDSRKFRNQLEKIKQNPKIKIFESDINPVFRALVDHYKGLPAPNLNVGLFDIETNFHPDKGFAPTDDPFNEVTSITVHQSYIDKLVTFALCPPTLTIEEARELSKEFTNTTIYEREQDLLEDFLNYIEDVDLLAGWNSDAYDVPYLVNRIRIILGDKATMRMCLYSPSNGWMFKPRPKEVMRFKKKFNSYDLIGRAHLDYLLLYKKHNPQQLHSYRLDYVGEIEVGENKIPYEGTLDELYKKDFKRFVAYNRQDVELLVKIDRKKKFIDLANQIAHANYVLLKTTMGSVSLVETAIINEMHDMGFVVPNRKIGDEVDDADIDDEERTPVVGAYVADPKKGLHEHIGCVDVNSLYPHAIMACNISPETIFGQIRPTETMALIEKRIAEGIDRAEAWDGIFETLEVKHMLDQDAAMLTVDFEDGTSRTFSGASMYNYVFSPKNHLCCTANGTLFKTDKDGIIPTLLAKWYTERKDMQKLQGHYTDMAEGIEIDDDLAKLLM